MEARIIGSGQSEYLWSSVIISTLLNAIICLLVKEVISKPTIQELDDAQGVNAYIISNDVTVSVKTHPHEKHFEIIVHCPREFSPDAISNLAVGYFRATSVIKENDEPPTKKYFVRVDSSAQWRLIESTLSDSEEVIVFTPDQKTP